MRKALAGIIAVGGWLAAIVVYLFLLVHGIVLVVHGATHKPDAQVATIVWGLVFCLVVASVAAWATAITGIMLGSLVYPSSARAQQRSPRHASEYRHAVGNVGPEWTGRGRS